MVAKIRIQTKRNGRIFMSSGLRLSSRKILSGIAINSISGYATINIIPILLN